MVDRCYHYKFLFGIGSTIAFVRYLGDIGYGSVIVMVGFVILSIVSFLGLGVGGVINLSPSMMSELNELGNIKGIRSIYTVQIQIFYFISIPLFLFVYIFYKTAE